MNKGLVLGFLTVFCWSISSVYCRYMVMNYDIHAIVFMAYTSFFAALALLVVAGRGRAGVEAIKEPRTWIYAVMNITTNILTVVSVAMITATEQAVLLRFSVLVAFLAGFLFFKRKPFLSDYIGSFIILLACVIAAIDLSDSVRMLALFVIALKVILQVGRTVSAEMHKGNDVSLSTADRLRCYAYIMLATSFAFLFVSVLSGMGAHLIGARIAMVPTFNDFINPANLWGGAMQGVFITALATYAYFYGAALLKTESMTMVIALLPVFTLGVEKIAALVFNLPITDVPSCVAYTVALPAVASIGMIIARHRKISQDS